MAKIKTLELKGGQEVEIKHTSEKYAIGWKDGLRALLLAVVTPVLLAVQQSIGENELTLNWKQLGLTALSAGVAYLIKNFFTSGEMVLNKNDVS